MSRRKKQFVGKIGYCDNKALGIKDTDGKPLKGGHYVYIREMKGANKCNVNVITSLEMIQRDKRGNIIKNGNGEPKADFVGYKENKIKRGYLYPIPKHDADFSLWSTINLDGNIKNVKISDIQNIGSKRIKTRHKWFVGKFTKKSRK